MRFRAHLLTLSAVTTCILACSEQAPILPPIVINVVGSVGGGSNGNAGSRNGTSASQNGNAGRDNQGGDDPGGPTAGTSSQNGLYAHCDDFVNGKNPPVKTACDLDALEDGGDLTGTITSDRTLSSGHFYTLKGGVKVAPGATLTVEPCVKVMGENPDAVLVVQSSALGDPKRSCTYDSGTVSKPAGKLIAIGEPMAPIIFTSAKDPGTRKPGDWGGVILLGNARNDLATLTEAPAGVRVPIEGLAQAECHGYHTDEFNDESSGHLEYVRVEYASRQVSEANETNGLTLGSVGSGTEMHYVMVSNSADDCFEWFGGTMNADHLIALNCDDDMFDADNGFSGHLQFLFGRMFPTTTEGDSRGMEIDTGAGLKNVKTSVAISNYTLCGGGSEDKNVSRAGLVFRTAAVPTLLNGYVTGFAGEGVLSQTAAVANLSQTHIFGQKLVSDSSGLASFLAGDGNSAEEPDRFCDCWANPVAPVPGTPTEGAAPSGFEDETARYLGAFASASPDANWMKGLWVDWSTE